MKIFLSVCYSFFRKFCGAKMSPQMLRADLFLMHLPSREFICWLLFSEASWQNSKEFEAEVAKDVYNHYLSDEEKEYLRGHDPDVMQRYMFGMGIRNSCIYPYLRM